MLVFSKCGLWHDRRGAHLVEYLLLVGLVSLLAMAGARAFGLSVTDRAEAQARALQRLRGSGAAAGSAYGMDPEAHDDDDGGGGLWGAVEGLAGGAADLGGDALDLAGKAISEGIEFKQGFERGVAKGAWGVATGLWSAATHPVRTVQALSYVSSHPFETAWALGDTYVDQVAENPAEGLGVIAFDAGATLLTSGAGGVLSKGTKASTIAGRVEKTDTTTTVVAAGDSAPERGAPGIVKWADKHIAPNFMPHIPRIRFP